MDMRDGSERDNLDELKYENASPTFSVRQLTNWFPMKYGVRHLAPYTLSPTDLIFRRSPWECRAARPRRTSSARTLGV